MSRILIVDDDPNLREMVAIRLKKAGHRVLAAGSAGEALAIVDQRGAPDLVVLDVLMPGMTGFELLPALRSIKGMQDLPAIFLSGRVEEHHIRAGRAMGAIYLTKPFSANALTKTIEKLEQRDVAVAPAGW